MEKSKILCPTHIQFTLNADVMFWKLLWKSKWNHWDWYIFKKWWKNAKNSLVRSTVTRDSPKKCSWSKKKYGKILGKISFSFGSLFNLPTVDQSEDVRFIQRRHQIVLRREPTRSFSTKLRCSSESSQESFERFPPAVQRARARRRYNSYAHQQ